MAAKPVAVSLNIDYPAMVEKPIKDGRGNDRIAEQFLPITEAFI